jgi:hypothetical protein
MKRLLPCTTHPTSSTIGINTVFEQNATMMDTSVQEDPSLMVVDTTQDQIAAAFGKPYETNNENGQLQDVYEFNPDSSKFVKPKVYARNIAAGVFTGGIATVVHQARIHATEAQHRSIGLLTDRMERCSRHRKNRANRNKIPTLRSAIRDRWSVAAASGPNRERNSGCRSGIRSRPR